MMSITLPPAALPCAMLLSAIFIAMWLGNKQSKIVDVFVLQIVIFCVLWLLFSVHVI